MVIFDFKTFIYSNKESYIIMKKNKKISISISLDPEIINLLNQNFTNKSKFLENCDIEELCKDKEFEEILKNKKIIL